MKWLLFLLLLTGCMVGPNYRKPDMAMPSTFIENKENQGCTDAELCAWWKQFGDPLLDSLIEEAAKKNFDIRIAIEQIIEARAQYKIQGSYLWPEIDLNAVASRSRYSQNIFSSARNSAAAASGSPINVTKGSTGGLTVQNDFQIGFDAIWELDFWGKFRRGKQAAYEEWEASEFNAQSVLITILSEVARDYVSIRSLQNQIALTKEKILADERELFLAKVLSKGGQDSQIQIDGFIATLESDKATLPILESSLKTNILRGAINLHTFYAM